MAPDDDLVRTLLIVVAVLVAIPFLMMAVAWPMMGMWGGGQMGPGGMGNGMGPTGWWIVAWLPLLLLLVGGGYLLYRVTGGTGGDQSDQALEELRVTYARGELSDEEFEQRRERLRRES